MIARIAVFSVAVGAALGGPSAWPATAPQPQAVQVDVAAEAAKQYEAIVRIADELFAEQSYRGAVITYERAARFAAANKLSVDAAALEAKLARARAGRDGKPIPAAPANGQPAQARPAEPRAAPTPAAKPLSPAATPQPAGLAAASPTAVPAPAGTRAPTKDAFDELVRLGDASFEAGDYFEAALSYERAALVAFEGHLAINESIHDDRLLRARRASEGKPMEAAHPGEPVGPKPPPGQAPPKPVATPRQQYEEAMVHGDAFCLSRDYLDAVLSYELAGRIALQYKLPDDAVRLQKRDLAAKARDEAARTPPGVLPEPKPPVPGYRSSFLRDAVEDPGKIRPWHFVDGLLPPAESKAFEANLLAIHGLILKLPLFAPLRGMDYSASANVFEASPGRPVVGFYSFAGFGHFEERWREKSTGRVYIRIAMGDEAHSVTIKVNSVPKIGKELWRDADPDLFAEPAVLGELGGFPVYGGTIVLTRPGVQPFVPATMARVMKAHVATLAKDVQASERSLAEKKANLEKSLGPETLAKRKAEIDALRAANTPTSRQQADYLEAHNRRLEERDRESLANAERDPAYVGEKHAFEEAKSRLAALDAASGAAPACVANPDAFWTWKLKVVPASDGGCARVMHENPAVFDPKLPRTAMQVISTSDLRECDHDLDVGPAVREGAGQCMAIVTIFRQIDWKQLAGLLAK
jgi:hypothetical protein